MKVTKRLLTGCARMTVLGEGDHSSSTFTLELLSSCKWRVSSGLGPTRLISDDVTSGIAGRLPPLTVELQCGQHMIERLPQVSITFFSYLDASPPVSYDTQV